MPMYVFVCKKAIVDDLTVKPLFHSSQYGAKNGFKLAAKMAAKIWQ